MKNPRTENIRRGSIQKTGIVWVQLIMTLAAATYNVRVIRDRDERMTAPRQEHVLLSADAETITHVELTSGQEQNLFEEYVNGVCLDDLEIAAGPSEKGTDPTAGRPADDASLESVARPSRHGWHKIWVSSSGASTAHHSLGTRAALTGDRISNGR